MDTKRRFPNRSKYIRHVGRLAFLCSLGFAYIATYVDVKKLLGFSKRSLDVRSSSLNVADFAMADSSLTSQANAQVPAPQIPPLKIPFPVLVASIFKSGTTSIHSYFQCGRQRSVHFFGENNLRTGTCMLKNLSERRDIFYGCGEYDIWTDNNAIEGCWDPSVFALDAFYNSYPNGTIILSTRDPDDWVNSVQRWGKLMPHLQSCKHLWPEQPQRNRTTEDIREFYLWQIEHVRQFAAAHPSLTYIDFSLDSVDVGSLLEEKIGIPASCWGKHNVFEESEFNTRNENATLGHQNDTEVNHEK